MSTPSWAYYEPGPGYEPCREAARASIARIEGYVQEWTSEHNVAYHRKSRNESEISIYSAWVSSKQEALTQRKRQLSETETQLKASQDGLKQLEAALAALVSARAGLERPVLNLIASIRDTLRRLDSQIDDEVSSLLDSIGRTGDPKLKQVMEDRVERLLGWKMFRTQVGGAEKAEAMFDSYVRGKNNEAERYVNEGYLDLLRRTRQEYQTLTGELERHDRSTEETKRNVAASQLRRTELSRSVQSLGAQVQQLGIDLYRLKFDLSAAERARDSAIARMNECSTKINQNYEAMRSPRYDLEKGCWDRHKVWRSSGDIRGGG